MQSQESTRRQSTALSAPVRRCRSQHFSFKHHRKKKNYFDIDSFWNESYQFCQSLCDHWGLCNTNLKRGLDVLLGLFNKWLSLCEFHFDPTFRWFGAGLMIFLLFYHNNWIIVLQQHVCVHGLSLARWLVLRSASHPLTSSHSSLYEFGDILFNEV